MAHFDQISACSQYSCRHRQDTAPITRFKDSLQPDLRTEIGSWEGMTLVDIRAIRIVKQWYSPSLGTVPPLSASCTALLHTSKLLKISIRHLRGVSSFSCQNGMWRDTLGFAVALQERGIPGPEFTTFNIVIAICAGRFPSMSSTRVQNSFFKFSTTLLLVVFEAVCNYEPVHLPLTPVHPRHVLNLVCRQWFNVIRSTGSLWNNIHFTKPGNDIVHQRHPLLKQLAFCAKLSGLEPLTIKFDMVLYEAWAFSVVRAVIIPYAHRIKTLSCLIVGNKDTFAFLTSSGGGKFDILESVDICFVNTKDTPIKSFPLKDWVQFTGLRNAPRLHEATFRLANGLHPLDLHLPWGQLTSLDFGMIPMTPEIFIKLLHSTASCLDNGFFCVRFSKPYYPGLILSRRVLSMRKLQTLRLLLFYPSQDTRLFSLLHLPVLQGLLGYCPVHQARARIQQNPSPPAPAGLSPHELGAEISGKFVVKRRHHAIPQHTLEALFTAVPRVDKLHLPPGVYIPAETAAQMGAYALLPELFYLEGSALDARPILAMARSRHALFLAAAPGPDEDSEFEEGSSQQPRRSLGPPTTIELLVPRDRPIDEKAAVVAEAQALGMLGIACTILSTDMLPLPVIDPRELMGSRLLAWVKGVPKEYLKI
ncbi:hypothetical protein BJ912DRAFT_1045719 [Pholiota molesta]|nr:hypothetical protein BJ912DRAFT_1045719 [Pholiota molesta]